MVGVVVVPVTGRWAGAAAFYHGDAVVYRWAGNVAPEYIVVLKALEDFSKSACPRVC